VEKLIHELPECKILIEQIARLKQTRAQLVEKDYWLMHALWGLQQQGFDFELKGGTSLSKGFEIIDRFSEDIDIRIEPPAELNVMAGKNQDKPNQIASRVAFYDCSPTIFPSQELARKEIRALTTRKVEMGESD